MSKNIWGSFTFKETKKVLLHFKCEFISRRGTHETRKSPHNDWRMFHVIDHWSTELPPDTTKWCCENAGIDKEEFIKVSWKQQR